MRLGRRAALSGLMALAAAAPRLGAAQPASPLVLTDRGTHRYTPAHFGCVGDGVADDTAALDAALRWLAARRLPLWLERGTYRMAASTPSWHYLGSTTQRTWRAALIDYDDFHLIGAGGRIVLSPPADNSPGQRWYAFSTALNLTPGAIRNVTFEGSILDLDDTFSLGRGGALCALVGVDGIVVRNSLIQNSARNIRGHGLTLAGCRDVRLEDFSIRHIQQGMFATYTTGVRVRGIRADRFTEALDFDAGCRDVSVIDGFFSDSTATRQSQCIDLAVEKAIVSNIRAERIPGNIIGCYAKYAWADLAEHIAKGERAPQAQPASDIVIDGVRGTDIGGPTGYPAIFFNLRRTGAGAPGQAVAQRQTLRNVTLTRSAGIAVREGEDCTLENIRLNDIRSGPSGRNTALWIGQADSGSVGSAESRLTGRFRDLRVSGTNHHGIIVEGLAEGSLSGLHVEGFGRAPVATPQPDSPVGIGLMRLSRRPGEVTLEGFTAIDAAQTGFAGLRIHDGWPDSASREKTVMDRGGHRLVGSVPVRVSGNAPWIRYWRPLTTVQPVPRGPGRLLVHSQATDAAQLLGASLEWLLPWQPGRSGGIAIVLVKRTSSGTEQALTRFAPLREPQPVGTRLDAAPPAPLEATLLAGEEILVTVQSLRPGSEPPGLDPRALTFHLALLRYATS